MQAYHVQTTVANDGSLKLNNLPFPAGESVEVIILKRPSASPRQKPFWVWWVHGDAQLPNNHQLYLQLPIDDCRHEDCGVSACAEGSMILPPRFFTVSFQFLAPFQE
jgi:hypothetical protein